MEYPGASAQRSDWFAQLFLVMSLNSMAVWALLLSTQNKGLIAVSTWFLTNSLDFSGLKLSPDLGSYFWSLSSLQTEWRKMG